MLRPQGYGVTTDPVAGITEEDTYTCGHCNAVVFVKAKCAALEAPCPCRMCMRFCCPGCLARGGCDPFEKKMERLEARDRMLRAVCG